jgi:hypothetical protein
MNDLVEVFLAATGPNVNFECSQIMFMLPR